MDHSGRDDSHGAGFGRGSLSGAGGWGAALGDIHLLGAVHVVSGWQPFSGAPLSGVVVA